MSEPTHEHPVAAALRAELREVLASWEYAFAMAHGCSYGTDPRLDPVRQRAADLQARLKEFTA
jgi:hypothetical protein